MQELFPIVAGVIVGLILGLVRPSMRPLLGVPLAVVLGITATVVSGEFRIGWEYLLIDIPLVGVAACVTLIATQRVVNTVRG